MYVNGDVIDRGTGSVEVAGKQYVIVHAGLDNFSPEKSLEEYKFHELIFNKPDYTKTYFQDKFLITGHVPTFAIEGNPNPNHIYRANNHIAIDCGAGFDGQVGALCLDSDVEFYSKE